MMQMIVIALTSGLFGLVVGFIIALVLLGEQLPLEPDHDA